MRKLSTLCVQSDIIWEDCDANLKILDNLLENKKADLIVLPEFFAHGFTMKTEGIAQEDNESSSLLWMKNLASKTGALVCGSQMIKQENRFYNRAFMARPNGDFSFYDKKHLFTMGGEHDLLSSGDIVVTIPWKGWNIRPLICYDLRFPVWSRNRSFGGSPEYDLLIYMANWPKGRANHWRSLLIARAIENQCWVVGVNRTGTDGNGIIHHGGSIVINPLGEVTNELNSEVAVMEAILDYDILTNWRKKFRVYKDWDSFTIDEDRR